MDLRNSVAELTGENLPVTVLFDYPSLSRMADYLLDAVLHLSESASAWPHPDPALAWEIDALSDAEAAERLPRASSDRAWPATGRSNAHSIAPTGSGSAGVTGHSRTW